MQNETANNLILRLPQVKARTGLSRTSIYNYMRGDERFPSSVRLGARSVGWVNQEVDAWLGSRISARQKEWKA